MVHSVLAVCFFKGTSTTSCDADGVSTYLALTFGTLLSSQGTIASFETVSPVSPGFPSGPFGLSCFQPYQIRFPFRFRSEFRFRPPVGAGCFAPSGVSTTLADSPGSS
jgi:hypothetical protein